MDAKLESAIMTLEEYCNNTSCQECEISNATCGNDCYIAPFMWPSLRKDKEK